METDIVMGAAMDGSADIATDNATNTTSDTAADLKLAMRQRQGVLSRLAPARPCVPIS